MTTAEFDALCRLLPGTPGRARDAACLVLIGGLVPAEAARQTGITPGAVSRILRRLREIETTGCPTCGRPALEE